MRNANRPREQEQHFWFDYHLKMYQANIAKVYKHDLYANVHTFQNTALS